LKKFEAVEKDGLRIHSLKNLSMVNDPAYLGDVITASTAKKANIGSVNNALSRSARRMRYSWHVLCPDFSVHAERWKARMVWSLEECENNVVHKLLDPFERVLPYDRIGQLVHEGCNVEHLVSIRFCQFIIAQFRMTMQA
jgi:hypothetical protein